MTNLAILERASPVFSHNHGAGIAAHHAELTNGLLAEHPYIAPKYFYDALGSKLFEAICDLPEYYPSRTEAGIFTTHLSEIAQATGKDVTLIDLGAGNCAKAARLFSAIQPAQYVPIDISCDFLQQAIAPLRQRFPHIDMLVLGQDFSSALTLPPAVRRTSRLFFYPGASIGNFSPPEAVAFLGRLRAACDAQGALLIGVDLIKDSAILDAAYDDALGVTAAFNLNLLRHVNQLLGSDFDVRNWRHLAYFNPAHSRIEMYLEARIDLVVSWPGAQRAFMRGERLHTENSYKYTVASFLALLKQAGFGAAQVWTDEQEWFAVIHAEAVTGI